MSLIDPVSSISTDSPATCLLCNESVLIPNPQLDEYSDDEEEEEECEDDGCNEDHHTHSNNCCDDDSHDHVHDHSHGPIPTHVLDDVLYPCSHHFHWTCILKHDFPTRDSIMLCPHCSTTVINNNGQLLCTVTSEGGVSPNFDLTPALLEEFDYRSNPGMKFELALCDACFVGDQFEVLQLVTGEGLDDDTDQDKKLYIPVNVNAPDLEKGWTPLFYASVAGHLDIVLFLLQNGADANVVDFFGRRAVDYAVEEKQLDVVEVLSKLGGSL